MKFPAYLTRTPVASAEAAVQMTGRGLKVDKVPCWLEAVMLARCDGGFHVAFLVAPQTGKPVGPELTPAELRGWNLADKTEAATLLGFPI